MNARPSFELSVDTRFLYERLVRTPVGATVTYRELGDEIGRAVDGSDGNLASALRRAFQIDGLVFANVPKLGYRRLTDAEIVKSATRDVEAVRRRARRAGKKLTKVQDFSAMTQQERTEHNAHLSIFAAITQMTKPNAVRVVESRVASTGRELPFAETIEAFRRGKG